MSELCARAVALLRERGWTVTTMESCTGGAVADALTDIPGASEVLTRAVVAYSNDAKIAFGVPAGVIASCGVYSPEVAEAMARAAKDAAGADAAVGVTGTLDRPDPYNPTANVGEVFVTVLTRDASRTVTVRPTGEGRAERKAAVVKIALQTLIDLLK